MREIVIDGFIDEKSFNEIVSKRREQIQYIHAQILAYGDRFFEDYGYFLDLEIKKGDVKTAEELFKNKGRE